MKNNNHISSADLAAVLTALKYRTVLPVVNIKSFFSELGIMLTTEYAHATHTHTQSTPHATINVVCMSQHNWSISFNLCRQNSQLIQRNTFSIKSISRISQFWKLPKECRFIPHLCDVSRIIYSHTEKASHLHFEVVLISACHLKTKGDWKIDCTGQDKRSTTIGLQYHCRC